MPWQTASIQSCNVALKAKQCRLMFSSCPHCAGLPERHPVSAPLVCKCLTSHHRGLWCSCWLQRCSWEGCMSTQSGKRQRKEGEGGELEDYRRKLLSWKRHRTEGAMTKSNSMYGITEKYAAWFLQNPVKVKSRRAANCLCISIYHKSIQEAYFPVEQRWILTQFFFFDFIFFLSLFLPTLSLSTSALLKVAACVKSQYVVIGVSINHSDMPRSLISGESLFGKTQRSREINFLCLNWPTAQSKGIVPILILLSGFLANVILHYVWVYMWEGTVKTACVQ